MQRTVLVLIGMIVFGLSSIFVVNEQFYADGSVDAPNQEEIKKKVIDLAMGPVSDPKCADDNDWCYRFENIKTNYADNIENPISVRPGDRLEINSNIFQSGEIEKGVIDIVFFVVDSDNNVIDFSTEKRTTFSSKNLEPLTRTFSTEKMGLYTLYLVMTSTNFNGEHIFDKIIIDVIVEYDLTFIIIIIAIILIGFLVMLIYRKLKNPPKDPSPFKPIED